MASDVRSDGAEMRGLSEYDALADLFLSHDHAKSMLSGSRTASGTSMSTPHTPGFKPHAPTMPVASEGGPALRFPREEPFAAATQPVDNFASEPASQPVRVEGLILGHLPVLGAAWVGQYAKHVAASSHAPVAILRIQEGHVSLDLVSPVGAAARAHSRVGASSMDPGSITLEAAIANARREASHWLIRVDEVHETDLLSLQGLSQVTLLTGADDAAIVSSYRTLKQLSRQLSHRDDEFSMTLGLAILGADETRASAAEAKLREGARTFLSTPIAPAAKVGKISPGTTTTVYRSQSGTADACQTLTAVLAMLDESRESAVPPVATLVESQPALQLPSPATESAKAARVQGADSVTPSRPAPQQGDLASLLGLIAADVTCPYAPSVQLAWSSNDGGLHLLMIHEEAADPTRELLAAAAWAHDHKALLTRLAPVQASNAATFGPTLHLVTKDLRSTRSLLDTAIRVHVLIEIKTGEGVVKAMAPAN
jgi:hypothetical protein